MWKAKVSTLSANARHAAQMKDAQWMPVAVVFAIRSMDGRRAAASACVSCAPPTASATTASVVSMASASTPAKRNHADRMPFAMHTATDHTAPALKATPATHAFYAMKQ